MFQDFDVPDHWTVNIALFRQACASFWIKKISLKKAVGTPFILTILPVLFADLLFSAVPERIVFTQAFAKREVWLTTHKLSLAGAFTRFLTKTYSYDHASF
jgi:hypothetical protein